MGVTLTVNGRSHTVAVPAGTRLLYVLRNDLALNGPKYGCGLGECGACAVLIDGVAARACVLPCAAAVGRQVTTLEGLAGSAVVAAFVAEQAAQCGYCLNGMIVTAHALLAREKAPTEACIREALRHNLCRCGAHIEIIRAVQRAAGAA